MGELVAWGLGLALGFSARQVIKTRRGFVLTVAAVLVVGGLVTFAAGEIWSEPWLVLVDICQVAIASVIGAFVLPLVLVWVKRIARTS